MKAIHYRELLEHQPPKVHEIHSAVSPGFTKEPGTDGAALRQRVLNLTPQPMRLRPCETELSQHV